MGNNGSTMPLSALSWCLGWLDGDASWKATIRRTRPRSRPFCAATRARAASKLRRSMRCKLTGTASAKTRRASCAVKLRSIKQHCLQSCTKPLASMPWCSPQKAWKASSTISRPSVPLFGLFGAFAESPNALSPSFKVGMLFRVLFSSSGRLPLWPRATAAEEAVGEGGRMMRLCGRVALPSMLAGSRTTRLVVGDRSSGPSLPSCPLASLMSICRLPRQGEGKGSGSLRSTSSPARQGEGSGSGSWVGCAAPCVRAVGGGTSIRASFV
mmetsp:Transcript_82646/g.229318  ORF Transcript_82646/g.229318 Transcript_82646/m.229318 type:complete len:269 (+) Transcript_82646:734-1540(+)